MEINANCLAYSAAIMGKAKQCRVIMVPNLSEAISDYGSSDAGVHGGRSMSLGHLVSILFGYSTYFLNPPFTKDYNE